MTPIEELKQALEEEADPKRAQFSVRYFKTGPGEPGFGDLFLGATVPAQRKLARRFRALEMADLDSLLQSDIHEHRLTALLILGDQYVRAKRDPELRQAIYDLYRRRLEHINNWDLVDTSAHIVGRHLEHAGQEEFDRMTRSENMWERRVAMVACQHLIRQGEIDRPFAIAERLLEDRRDLIQKAVGWMLREVGAKHGLGLLRAWLVEDRRYEQMGRTALRYAIEHYPPEERREFLHGSA